MRTPNAKILHENTLIYIYKFKVSGFLAVKWNINTLWNTVLFVSTYIYMCDPSVEFTRWGLWDDLVCVFGSVRVRVPVCASICAVSMLPFHYIFKWFYTWYNRSLCLYRESAHACSSLPHCMCSTSLCASVYVHSGTSASASVHRGGNVWNGVAGEVLQLQQEGSLPVGKQLQQHWIRMQTQRHAYAHVGQQGDVCVMVWKIF